MSIMQKGDIQGIHMHHAQEHVVPSRALDFCFKVLTAHTFQVNLKAYAGVFQQGKQRRQHTSEKQVCIAVLDAILILRPAEVAAVESDLADRRCPCRQPPEQQQACAELPGH